VEFLATVKFLLVTVIILPVLPNKEYTSFLINPAKVWQIVIIVSTLGFIGYLLEKKFGAKIGLWLSGIFGGIVSSTAMTVSMGRMARKNPGRSRSALQSALLACSMMYLRILVLIWFINASFIPGLFYRLLILAGIGFILSFIRAPKESQSLRSGAPDLQNPFEIRPAIGFAVLFVVLSVIVGFVKSTMGFSGLLTLSAVVGVTDITPFVLSVVQGPDTEIHILTSAIVLSLMSNTISKGAYFWSLSGSTRKETVLKFSIYALLHIPFILW
jgi:uncharacterized membrane protein (DUF4010 family)